MEILGIHKIVIGTVKESFTVLKDFGLLEDNNVFKTLNGSSIEIDTSATGVTEIHWAAKGIENKTTFVDNNIKHIFDPSLLFNEVTVDEHKTNTFTQKNRINKQVNIIDDNTICGIAHVAIYSNDFNATIEKFQKYGFVISDAIKDRAVFLRSKQSNPHHQILIVQSSTNTGLQHISFNVKDIYSVFTKGLNLSSRGYKTVLGPGRHAISSSTTWYFETAIGLLEISADEDYVTHQWKPTVYDPGSSLIYEWAIEHGLNPETRRQHNTQVLSKFVGEPKNK